MPEIVGPVRHHDITATLGPHGFVPYLGPRRPTHHDCGTSCSCRTCRVPSKAANKRAPAKDTAAKIAVKLQAMTRKATTANDSLRRMSDSLDRLDSALHHACTIADLRRAAFSPRSA